MIERQPARSLSQELLPACENILLKTSERDDALCYHACMSSLANGQIMVQLHESSLLLDRVRLMGSLLVIVESSGAKFVGELRSVSACVSSHEASLALELVDRLETLPAEQQLFPRT